MIHRVMNFFICASLACLMISCSALGLRIVFDSDSTAVALAEIQDGIEAGNLYYKLSFKDDVTLVPDSQGGGIRLTVGNLAPFKVAPEGLRFDPWNRKFVYFGLREISTDGSVSSHLPMEDDLVKIQVLAGTFQNSSGTKNKDLFKDITVDADTSPPNVIYYFPSSLTPYAEIFTIVLTESISPSGDVNQFNTDLANGTEIVVNDNVGTPHSPVTVDPDKDGGLIWITFPTNLSLNVGDSVTITIKEGLFNDSNAPSQINETLTISNIPVVKDEFGPRVSSRVSSSANSSVASDWTSYQIPFDRKLSLVSGKLLADGITLYVYDVDPNSGAPTLANTYSPATARITDTNDAVEITRPSGGVSFSAGQRIEIQIAAGLLKDENGLSNQALQLVDIPVVSPSSSSMALPASP